VDVFNLHGDEWDRVEEREGWRSKDAWVGARLGAELIGGSLYELEPGDRLWPYHAHHANEEWLIVVRARRRCGRRTVSTSSASATSPVSGGARTAHTRSRTGQAPPSVCWCSRALLAPEIVVYLDMGKVGTRDARGDRLTLARPGPPVDYWEGER
jgi:uncharacterized cupin superfamily protein